MLLDFYLFVIGVPFAAFSYFIYFSIHLEIFYTFSFLPNFHANLGWRVRFAHVCNSLDLVFAFNLGMSKQTVY